VSPRRGGVPSVSVGKRTPRQNRRRQRIGVALPADLHSAMDAFERWIVVGDLPPEHVGNPRFWDCMVRALLRTHAQRMANTFARAALRLR
jgi:hypothetical protein